MGATKELPTIDRGASIAEAFDFAYHELLPDIAQRNPPEPTGEELIWCKTALGWADHKEIKRHLRIVRSIQSDKAIAGNEADRANLAEALAAAEDALATEGSKIRKKLEDLQKQLGALEREAGTLRKRNADVGAALERLAAPERLPQAARDEYEQARQAYHRGLRHHYHSVQTQVKHLQILLDPGLVGDAQRWHEVLRQYDHRFAVLDVERHQLRTTPEYEAAVPGLKGELQEALKLEEKLKAECEREEARLKRILEYWWD